MGETIRSEKRKRSHSTVTEPSSKRAEMNKMEIAKEHLQLSHVPDHIPCREKERKVIADYLRNSIIQKGNGSPLYISGKVTSMK